MTLPNPSDTNAIAGAHPGIKNISELENDPSFNLSELVSEHDVTSLARETKRKTDWSLSFLTDPGKRPNYAINPDVTYLANGSFSLFADIGGLVFSDKSTEPKPGHFELSKEASTMKSSAGETTLGSRDIKTLEGKETNFLDTIFPSTNFTPIKTWIQSIWPFSTEDLIKLTILELIQAALLKGIEELIEDNLEGDSRKVVRERSDLALEIQDNQEIEQDILNSLL